MFQLKHDESFENRGVEDMNEEKIVRLCGGIGSPYSNKMLMILRYRRIPHRWIMTHAPEERGTANPKGPVLLPKIVWPDDTVSNDSTFLVKRLERMYEGRSVIPSSPGLAFLSSIVEDFADEFVTKCMYHYRWTKDPIYASKNIILQQMYGPHASRDILDAASVRVRERQVGRLPVVGSNKDTAPAIEAFYKDFIRCLDAHLEDGHPFLFGTRPSVADFALLGQLHPMIALDPETSSLTSGLSGRVCAWYHVAFDLSGLSVLDERKGWLVTEGNWKNNSLPKTLKDIFDLIGRWYVPFMLENDRAYRRGAKTMACELDSGRVTWTQPTFKYQSKCVSWLREDFAKLPRSAKDFVRKSLRGTGVMDLVLSSAGAGGDEKARARL